MAIELVTDPQTKERAPELQRQVAEQVLHRGVLVDSSTTSEHPAVPGDAARRAWPCSASRRRLR